MKITPVRALLGEQKSLRLKSILMTAGCLAALASLNLTALAQQAASGTKERARNLTALDRYVAAADTNYSYKLLTSAPTPAGTVHILEMTSQAWLTTNEVDKPVWKHWIALACPKQITSSTGLLFITGGGNDKEFPNTPELALRRMDGTLIRIAIESKSVVAEVHNVPNQPLVFGNDGVPRSEDKLIAYTWDKFLRNGDERWPARLPMTKSAVRAMDTITAFCATPEGGNTKVDRFTVAGGSKRGWTTWTTAAVDKRVVAISPIVIDVLNMEPSMKHHYAAYGFWAPAIGDYENQRLMDWFGTPQNRALAHIEDPYEYRDRYTMPKLLLNSTGDQFFLPDSSQFYWDDLPGPKYLRYVPNADHSMKNTDAWETLAGFYQSILAGKPMPHYTWKFEGDRAIRVKLVDKPREIKLWQATNPNARDFRLDTFGAKWTSTPLTAENDVCVAKVAKPEKGWTAFMAEMTYDGPDGKPLKLTTSVRVIPDKTNFKWTPQKL
jgi:PhoPQ-activated pathogenicity-related protein